jgi:hypothetical protein
MDEIRPRISVIEQWMGEVIHDGGMERLDDLHVDRIDLTWADRSRWIDAAIQSFQLALDIRTSHGYNCVVACAFSLEDDSKGGAMPPDSPEVLLTQMDWSPPSLYLFGKIHEWDSIQQGSERNVALDNLKLFGVRMPCSDCRFVEFKREDLGEVTFRRSIWLIG